MICSKCKPKLNIRENKQYDLRICDFVLDQKEIALSHLINPVTVNCKDVVKQQISCFAYWKVIEKRFCDYFDIYVIGNFCNFFSKNLVNIIDTKYSPYRTNTVYIDESISIKSERRTVEESLKNLLMAEEDIKKIT